MLDRKLSLSPVILQALLFIEGKGAGMPTLAGHILPPMEVLRKRRYGGRGGMEEET